MSNGVWTSILEQVTKKDTSFTKISIQEYEDWKKSYIMEGLQGKRFGQSFCNHFQVNDYILFYLRGADRCDKHIKKYYIKSNCS